MSYETNKRLKRQILRAERRKEREILLLKHKLEKIHEIRRQQSLNLRVGLKGLTSSRSESSIFDEIHKQEMRRKLCFNDDYSQKIIHRNGHSKLQAGRSNFPCCLENALSLLNKDIEACDHQAQAFPAPVSKKQGPVKKHSTAPDTTHANARIQPRVTLLRKSTSAHELRSLHLANTNQSSSKFEINEHSLVHLDRSDYTTQSKATSEIRSSLSPEENKPCSHSADCHLNWSKAEDESGFNWLRTGTPPLTDSHPLRPEHKTAAKPTISPGRTSVPSLPLASLLSSSSSDSRSTARTSVPAHGGLEVHATTTVQLVQAVPICSNANSNTGEHAVSFSATVIERTDLKTIPSTINEITPVCSPKEPLFPPHMKSVTPRAQVPNKKPPNYPMNGLFSPRVSYMPSVVGDSCISTINPTCFQPFKPTNSCAPFPQSSTGNYNHHGTSATGNVHFNHMLVSNAHRVGIFDPHAQRSPPRLSFSRPHSAEAVVKDDVKQITQGPIQRVGSPLRSILKSQPSAARNSPERLPGFYENFSELTALRTRDSIELAPVHLRLNSARDVLSIPRDPSPDTLDGSETERSGTPRTARKTVRFADQIASDALRRRAYSTGSSNVCDLFPTGVNKPRAQSVPASPTCGKTNEQVPIGYSEPGSAGQNGVVYLSSGFDAPIRNTILPSLALINPVNSTFTPNAVESFRAGELYPMCEISSSIPESSISSDNCSKENCPQGKPPIKPPQQKFSASTHLTRTGKPGYTDLYFGRPRRLVEQVSNASPKIVPSSATIDTPPLVASDVDVPDTSRSSLSPTMSTERKPGNEMKIPSIRNFPGPPASNRCDHRERKMGTKIVDTAKLNEMTHAASEPLRQIPSTALQSDISIPSAFNALRLTCPPDATEKEKLAALTRLTELNYETSLTSTDPSLSIQPSQAMPNLPDYEGVDTGFPEKIKLLQQKQGLQHAIYLSGQPNMDQRATLPTRNARPLATPVISCSTNYQGEQQESTSSIDSCSRSSSSARSQTLSQGDQPPARIRSVHPMEERTFPPSSRLLNRRPQTNTSVRSTQMNSHSVTAAPVISPLLERQKLTSPVFGCENLSSTISPLRHPSRFDMRSLTSQTLHGRMALAMPKSSTFPCIPSYLGGQDAKMLHQMKFKARLPITTKPLDKSLNGIAPRQFFPSPAGANAHTFRAQSADKLSESMVEFLESENACHQPAQPFFPMSQPIRSSRTPGNVDRVNLRIKKERNGPSAISIEEARLLKSLERLNNRLCDILSDR